MGFQDGRGPTLNGSDNTNASSTGLGDEATSKDEIVTIDGEACVRALTLRRDLTFKRPSAIRSLIERHRPALETLGPLATRSGKSCGQDFTLIFGW